MKMILRNTLQLKMICILFLLKLYPLEQQMILMPYYKITIKIGEVRKLREKF